MFEQSMVAAPPAAGRSVTFAASLSVQVLMAGTLLLIPLFLVEGPGIVRLHTALMAPPPPPPPAVKLVAVPARVLAQYLQPRALFAPRHIPATVAAIHDHLAAPGDLTVTDSQIIGVPGGIPHEQHLPGMFRGREIPPPPEPDKAAVKEPPAPAAPIKVGGDVQAAKIVRRIVPAYPPLAKAARISGTVRLLGVISRDGRIQQLQVLSGHPLLVSAAAEAVRQWVYQPTLLNKEPVEVIAPIDVHFTLSQ